MLTNSGQYAEADAALTVDNIRIEELTSRPDTAAGRWKKSG
ncbi:MAG: hypothetical protein ACLSG5_14870 [Oscillospiraceae bacterium]